MFRIILILMAGSSTTVCGQVFRGWYEAGGSYIHEAKIESFYGEPVSDNEIEFDPGFRAGIALGRALLPWLTVEVEGGFHYNTVKSIAGATAHDARLYQVPVMGNMVVQFPNRTRLVPSIGGGAGAVYSILDPDQITIGATTTTESDETWAFAYQGYAALRYQFSKDMAIGVAYHCLVNDAPGFKDDGALLKFNRLINHSISLSFGFEF